MRKKIVRIIGVICMAAMFVNTAYVGNGVKEASAEDVVDMGNGNNTTGTAFENAISWSPMQVVSCDDGDEIRYYKFVLENDRLVTFRDDSSYGDFKLYNQYGELLDDNYNSYDTLCSINLKAGTYYVRTEAKYTNLYFVALPSTTASAIALNATTLNMKVDDKVNLSAALTPSDCTDTVTWTSGDSSIAQVDENGRVTAMSVGSVMINATAKNGKMSASCAVYVSAPTINKISGLKVKSKKNPYNKKGKMYTVRWKKQNNVSGYVLYVSKKKNKGFVKCATSDGNQYTSYTHSVNNKKKRYFKVRAYRTIGGTVYYGPYSNVK